MVAAAVAAASMATPGKHLAARAAVERTASSDAPPKSTNIRVVVRTRPLNDEEKNAGKVGCGVFVLCVCVVVLCVCLCCSVLFVAVCALQRAVVCCVCAAYGAHAPVFACVLLPGGNGVRCVHVGCVYIHRVSFHAIV